MCKVVIAWSLTEFTKVDECDTFEEAKELAEEYRQLNPELVFSVICG